MALKRRTKRLNPSATPTPVTNTHTTTSVTNAQIQAMINEGVIAALAQRDATTRMAMISILSGTGVRRACAGARECTFPDFLKCQPLNFKGPKKTDGVWMPREFATELMDKKSTLGPERQADKQRIVRDTPGKQPEIMHPTRDKPQTTYAQEKVDREDHNRAPKPLSSQIFTITMRGSLMFPKCHKSKTIWVLYRAATARIPKLQHYGLNCSACILNLVLKFKSRRIAQNGRTTTTGNQAKIPRPHAKETMPVITTQLSKWKFESNFGTAVIHQKQRAPNRLATDPNVKATCGATTELTDKVFIRPSSSPWGATESVCKEKDGLFRMCIDYMGIEQTDCEEPLPTPKDRLTNFEPAAKCRVFIQRSI
ncbi:hypothetical protein Tco_0749933 [Tanacetum coccineum]|uniref:Uncharacterized protein n=1 Tax=Tanacetum coccineum TaxID=301880 RepID=A0ABQ4Z2J6_9ASTR